MVCRLILSILGLAAVGCQNYPFELRLPASQHGVTLTQDVRNPTPTDVLFVIDNSASMAEERAELQANVNNFIAGLAASETDFHVGIITTDLECNVPERGAPNSGPVAGFSNACMRRRDAFALPRCQELDTNQDGQIDYSNCDAGRLRGLAGKSAFFSRPAPGQAGAWATDFSAVIGNLGCAGSGYEAGLETARRAINCSVFGHTPDEPEICPTASIAQLNAGFIRPEADLVLIFVSDEDDCSFRSTAAYAPPADASNLTDQANHLCTEEECYAYYNMPAQSRVGPWASSAQSIFQCSGVPRTVDPPVPDSIGDYLAAFAHAKGDDPSRVRAAAIVSGVAATDGSFAPSPCISGPGGPSNACGCWSASADPNNGKPLNGSFYCQLTRLLSNRGERGPLSTESNLCAQGTADASSNLILGGCSGMPGGRYAQFLGALQTARQQAGVDPTTLVSSICQASYTDTMAGIVNTIILTRCFALGQAAVDPNDLYVERNGVPLTNVAPESGQDGWSLRPGAKQVCLEGRVQKNLGDHFGIFVLN